MHRVYVPAYERSEVTAPPPQATNAIRSQACPGSQSASQPQPVPSALRTLSVIFSFFLYFLFLNACSHFTPTSLPPPPLSRLLLFRPPLDITTTLDDVLF